ncbi:MAG: DUF1109 domain-containing protein [Variovorax sp.]|nr:DUF1109 domain-containing protein [Variovorax sp.]
MKTDELVAMLAANAAPVRRHAARRQWAAALLAGVLLGLVVMQLVFGARRDLMQVMGWPMFWVRLLVPLCIAAGAYLAVERLARPGARVGGGGLALLVVPVLFIWLLAAIVLASAPAGSRPALLMGQTWRTCTANIALVALPVFACAMIALKGLAPTRPAHAGAAAGALAGAVGAAIYALHCQEFEAPFLAIWYVLGISLPAALGALVGARLLRW